MSKLRVMIGIDMETDVGSFTSSYEGFKHGTPLVLDVLKHNAVTATFFFTGDGIRRNPGIATLVRHAGHEIGCHTLFHETIGDPLFDIARVPTVLAEEVDHRLELATRWVEDGAGVRPVSFRAPCLFGSTAMVNALDRLGYVADATYPMYFYRDRLTPYHPHREDWTKPGDLRIVELPNFADLSMESKDPYGRDRDQWPKFRTQGANALMGCVDGFIGYCRKAGVDPFLCFYFHPWEFHPMPQGDIPFAAGSIRPDPFIVKNCGPYATEQFDLLIKRLKKRGAGFFQAKDMAADCARW